MIPSLQDLCLQALEGKRDLNQLRKLFASHFAKSYSETSQLSKAYFALIAHLLELEPSIFHPEQFPNGTALLETIGGSIPEPTSLAQLGVLWMILGIRLKNEVLQRAGLKISLWHTHLFDSQGKLHLSLWSSARFFSQAELSYWSYALFKLAFWLTKQERFDRLSTCFHLETSSLPAKLLALISELSFQGLNYPLRSLAEEMTVGMVKFMNPEISLMAHLSGSNSGLFSLHKKDIAIVNCGPQVGSYDHLDHFGISRLLQAKGRPFQDIVWERSPYHCHLKGWTKLAKEPVWLHLDAKMEAGQASFDIVFQEKKFGFQLSMILFLRGSQLILEGKKRIEPASLERYDGKATTVVLQGNQEQMIIEPDSQASMQVIPLAGGEHFWGAQFLVAFPISEHPAQFSISVK